MPPKKRATAAATRGAAAAAAKKQKETDADVVEVKPEGGTCAPKAPNFTIEEDVALAKAYVSCTNNPLCGVEQKAEQFFASIADKYLS